MLNGLAVIKLLSQSELRGAQVVISVFNVTNLKKKFLFKQERDSYSSFNRASFVTFVTAKVTI